MPSATEKAIRLSNKQQKLSLNLSYKSRSLSKCIAALRKPFGVPPVFRLGNRHTDMPRAAPEVRVLQTQNIPYSEVRKNDKSKSPIKARQALAHCDNSH